MLDQIKNQRTFREPELQFAIFVNNETHYPAFFRALRTNKTFLTDFKEVFGRYETMYEVVAKNKDSNRKQTRLDKHLSGYAAS